MSAIVHQKMTEGIQLQEQSKTAYVSYQRLDRTFILTINGQFS